VGFFAKKRFTIGIRIAASSAIPMNLEKEKLGHVITDHSETDVKTAIPRMIRYTANHARPCRHRKDTNQWTAIMATTIAMIAPVIEGPGLR